MASTLFRFPKAEGLVHLLGINDAGSDQSNARGQSHDLASLFTVQTVHDPPAVNGGSAVLKPSIFSVNDLLHFDHLVCDFDETITDHDTTSSFDTLAEQKRSDVYDRPELSWSEILQAYLDDLDKVDVGDLCHLNVNSQANARHVDGENGSSGGQDADVKSHVHEPTPHHAHSTNKKWPPLLDPTVRSLKCHIDGRTFTPEPDLPVPKVASLQPWIQCQVRKRAVEKVSLDRVDRSGNLVGLTRAQIREYGRTQVKLRPGMVQLLRAFVAEQDRQRRQQEQEQEQKSLSATTETLKEKNKKLGELWIVSVNWSKDLIRGAMEQVFGSEEATHRYLPDSHLISSNLMFSEECHELLMNRRKSSSAGNDVATIGLVNESSLGTDRSPTETETETQDQKDKREARSSTATKTNDSDSTEHHLSNGGVHIHCLTGTDKLHAFQKIQQDFAVQHGLTLADTKWAYFGDSSTDLGCLVEADVGIIIGSSKSLLTECGRSGIRVVDFVQQT